MATFLLPLAARESDLPHLDTRLAQQRARHVAEGAFGHYLCSKYLLDSHIVNDGWINKLWIEKYIDKDELDVKYVNKFLGLLAFEIWYRLFITKDMNENTVLT